MSEFCIVMLNIHKHPHGNNGKHVPISVDFAGTASLLVSSPSDFSVILGWLSSSAKKTGNVTSVNQKCNQVGLFLYSLND